MYLYYLILQTKKGDNETPMVMARQFENRIESSTTFVVSDFCKFFTLIKFDYLSLKL